MCPTFTYIILHDSTTPPHHSTAHHTTPHHTTPQHSTAQHTTPQHTTLKPYRTVGTIGRLKLTARNECVWCGVCVCVCVCVCVRLVHVLFFTANLLHHRMSPHVYVYLSPGVLEVVRHKLTSLNYNRLGSCMKGFSRLWDSRFNYTLNTVITNVITRLTILVVANDMTRQDRSSPGLPMSHLASLNKSTT